MTRIMTQVRKAVDSRLRRVNFRRAVAAVQGGREAVRHRPVEAFLEIVSDCNIRCTMCAISFDHRYRKGPADYRGHMKWSVFEEAFPLLRHAAKVHLMGTGEPMLHPDLPRMVRAVAGTGAWVTFNSNGTLLDESVAEELVTAGLSQMVLSLDGATAETFEGIRRGASFESVIDNVSRLTDLRDRSGALGPELLVSMVLMRQNAHELDAMVDLAASLGARLLHVEPLLWQDDPDYGAFYDRSMVPRAEATERLRALQSRVEARGIGLTSPLLDRARVAVGEPGGPGPVCTEPWTTLFITREGRLRPCCNSTVDLGGLGNGGWNAHGFREYRRAFAKGNLPDGCGSCARNGRFRRVLGIDAPLVGIPTHRVPEEAR